MQYLADVAIYSLLTMTAMAIFIFVAEYGMFMIVPFVLLGDAIAYLYKRARSIIRLRRHRKKRRVTEYNSEILEMLGIR